jgi:hypothetical protein
MSVSPVKISKTVDLFRMLAASELVLERAGDFTLLDNRHSFMTGIRG